MPANFLNKKAGYVNTGVWSKKAIMEAKRFGEVEVLAASDDRNFTYIPKSFAIPTDLDYLHITTNRNNGLSAALRSEFRLGHLRAVNSHRCPPPRLVYNPFLQTDSIVQMFCV